MTQMLFSERVNAASNIITNMTGDPSERLGIAVALCEIYKHDLRKYLEVVPVKPTIGGSNANTENANATDPVSAKPPASADAAAGSNT